MKLAQWPAKKRHEGYENKKVFFFHNWADPEISKVEKKKRVYIAARFFISQENFLFYFSSFSISFFLIIDTLKPS